MTTKKYISTLLLILAALSHGWAQDTQAALPAAQTEQFPQIMTLVLLTAMCVLFVVAIVLVIRTNAFLTHRLLRLEAEKSGVVLPEDVKLAQAIPVQDDFLTRLRKKYWENPVPQEREGDIMLNHNYDGIRELDNHLPPWWVNMFVLTILWAGGYMWYYHLGGNGPDQENEYKMDVEKAKKEIAVALAGKANAVDEANVTVLTDGAAIGEGELIYKTSCAACHGQLGEGLVGPNFTDAYWLHGGGIKNVFKTIKYGVPEKGMIAWASQLKPADMQKVATYILTLQGTNPPNPKAPQGELWKEEVVMQDTTAAPKS